MFSVPSINELINLSTSFAPIGRRYVCSPLVNHQFVPLPRFQSEVPDVCCGEVTVRVLLVAAQNACVCHLFTNIFLLVFAKLLLQLTRILVKDSFLLSQLFHLHALSLLTTTTGQTATGRWSFDKQSNSTSIPMCHLSTLPTGTLCHCP